MTKSQTADFDRFNKKTRKKIQSKWKELFLSPAMRETICADSKQWIYAVSSSIQYLKEPWSA